MPVKVAKQGNKYRLIEPTGKIAKTSTGKSKDGGGHESKTKAEAQARAINTNIAKKRGEKR